MVSQRDWRCGVVSIRRRGRGVEGKELLLQQVIKTLTRPNPKIVGFSIVGLTKRRQLTRRNRPCLMVQNVEHLHLHGGCVGKAILGFELQCSVDELIGLFAQVWAMFFERKIVAILYALEHFHIGIAPEGSCAREGFVQNDAETEEIGARSEERR